MKFLVKRKNSEILKASLKYKKNAGKKNKELREKLLEEQFNFCAYTEKSLEKLDSAEVEHFNSEIKYQDDYFNYYAVIRDANLRKKDEKYKGAIFFKTLFFQKEGGFEKRIKFIPNEGIYEERDLKDLEAVGLIDFLGFNDHSLVEQRKNHISRIRRIFEDAQYLEEEKFEYFRDFPQERSFITAIEAEFGLNLSEFYT